MAVQLDLFRSMHYGPPRPRLPLDIVANGRISGNASSTHARGVAGSDLHHPLRDDITRGAAHWTALRGSGI